MTSLDTMDYRNQTDSMNENILPAKKNKSVISMLPYKIAFFALFGARAVVVSFYPLYLKQLGLDPEQIGIVMFSRPVGGLAGCAVSTFLTSLLKNYSVVLYLMASLFLMSGISINFLSPSPLAIQCDRFGNGSVFNISSEAETVIESSDRSWMYEGDPQFLFVCSFVIGFSVDFYGIGVDTVQHGATMMALGKDNTALYGQIRAWGALGNAAAAVSTGLFLWSTQSTLKICAQMITIPDYHLFSYTFIVLSLVLLLSVNTTSTVKKECATFLRNENTAEDMLGTLCSLKVLPWLYVLISRSVFCAVTQGFLNWHMESIGASPLLIGTANAVTTITEFVMFFLTPFLIRRFGHTVLASVGITSYVIRLLIYSVVTQPIYILPVEIFEGMMFAILWASIVAHLSNQVSRSKQSQMQGVILAVYMTGTGIGFLLSGYLTQVLGAPDMFRIFACMAACTSVTFVMSQAVSSKCKKSK